MKLVTFRTDGEDLRPGIWQDHGVVDLLAANPKFPGSLRQLLDPSWRRQLEAIARDDYAPRRQEVRLAAPIPDPGKVVCIGLNYRDHAAESGSAIPEEPIVFSKFSTAVIGPDQDIQLPAISQQVDFEAELVVVIGRRGTDISAGAALDHVCGYTAGHDVSARDWQLARNGKQWLLGKTFDTFAPIGPVLVTRDEIPNPHGLAIRLRLNGQTMQDSNTSQFIFDIPRLIQHISQFVTLEPGDLIFTGTPSGVGFARKPPVFLKPGDVCEVEIEGIGVLRNRCVAR